MKGFGLLVGTIFFILILAVVYTNCNSSRCEGFEGVEGKRGPVQLQQIGPVPRKELTDLPSAAYSNLPDIPVPATDPAEGKTLFSQLVLLKADMDGFHEREYPYMVSMSDPTIQLPLTRFKGDYQTVKDELLVLSANPGLSIQLTYNQLESIGANLRFLQKKYRTLEGSQLVPVNSVEGFTSMRDDTSSITPDQLDTLNTKLLVEIARLSASGTSDPIIKSRINIFTKIQQSVNDLADRIKNKTLDPLQIPIKTSDYNVFLPALGDTSAGIGGLLSSSGLGSLSSLFNAYDTGDISGSQLTANLLDRYADSILNGLSYSVSLSYTSPNEVNKEMARAAQVQVSPPRGEFEHMINEITTDGFSNGNDPSPGMFDWKQRSLDISKAIAKLGLNPSDFGCIEAGAQVSPDYSWRGNARMVCSRAATHSDPGLPEQIGCPPVSWKGWRN
jgi:hypothetical protein